MHAIVITNSKPDTEYIESHSLNFKVDEFGWNHIRYYDPNYKASYLWTIIVNNFLKQVYTGEKISLSGQEYDKCYFVFDTMNKYIYCYDRDEVERPIKNSGINLSFRNLINEVKVNESSDDIITALTVTGAEGVGINVVNPLGNNIIYDFQLLARYDILWQR